MSLCLAALMLALAPIVASDAQESAPVGLWEAYQYGGNELPTQHIVVRIGAGVMRFSHQIAAQLLGFHFSLHLWWSRTTIGGMSSPT